MLPNYKVWENYVADRPCGWLTLPWFFTLLEIGKDIFYFAQTLEKKFEYFIESKNEADKVKSRSVNR